MRRRPGPVPRGVEPRAAVAAALLRRADGRRGRPRCSRRWSGWGPTRPRFEDWGVVAASRYLGRANLAPPCERFDGRGGLGRLAAPDPAFRAPFAVGHDQPGAGAARAEPGRRRRAARRGRGVPRGPDLAGAGVVPGVWLVLSGWSPELRPAPEGGAARRPASARPWPWRWWPGAGERPGRGSGSSTGADGPRSPDARRPGPAGRGPGDGAESRRRRTIATDPSGRLRVELVPGGAGRPGTRA